VLDKKKKLKIFLIEHVRAVLSLWDQSNKKYHNRYLKPILRDEMGEKLKVTGSTVIVILMHNNALLDSSRG